MENKTTKLISILMLISIISVVLFSVPKKANALWGILDIGLDAVPNIATGSATAGATGTSAGANTSTAATSATGSTAGTSNTALHVKDRADSILKQVLMGVARKVLEKMTSSIVNWVNSGFHGQPLFLENPESFFKDIVKSEVKQYVDLFGYDLRQFPFGKDFALNAINSYKETLRSNTAYTLNKYMSAQEAERYRNDFSVGGWNGWLVNTQYPQNNYTGFQQEASRELSRKLAGTSQAPAEKVQGLLQQGAGFLSPQTCPSNDKYPTATNPYNPPRFDSSTVPNNCNGAGNPCGPLSGSTTAESPECAACLQSVADAIGAEQDKWAKTNTCPGGLVNTTPGSVIASKITTALNLPENGTLQAMGLGNSLSMIFDALLNKFIGDGLNSLASKSNPQAQEDNWSYQGQTLGSPQTNPNSAWNSGPEEPIILDDFKKLLDGKTIVTKRILVQPADQNFAAPSDVITVEEVGDTTGTPRPGDISRVYVPGDIKNTEKEISLLDNKDLSRPGAKQMFNKVWPMVQKLDRCLPGPDLGWEDRLKSQVDRTKSSLEQAGNGLTIEQQQKIEKQTKDGLNFITDAIKKIISGGTPSLPDTDIEPIQTDPKVTDAVNLVVTELRGATKSFSDWINDEMLFSLPGAALYADEVKNLEPLYTQAKEIIDQRRVRTNALLRLKAIKASLDPITIQPKERTAEEKILISLRKKYDATRISISNPITLGDAQNILDTLKDKLNNLQNPVDPTKGLIPKCNAERLAKGYPTWDYSIATGETKPYPQVINGLNTSPTEKAYFCDLPIKGGDPHEMFTGTTGTHLDQLLLVNSTNDVLSYPSNREFPSDPLKALINKAYIQLNCTAIFNAGIQDYQQDLPPN